MRDEPLIHLDVRQIPPWQRHPKIFEAFDNLEVGAELRITTDHEPRPLRSELERTRAGRYVWVQHMLASEHWEVTLRRVDRPRIESVGEFLRRCALFADASPSSLSALEAAAIDRTFGHGEPITEQGADWDAFGVVEHGVLSAVMISALGREHALYDILSREPFGEISTIHGGSTVARFVVTSSAARVLLIPKSTMRDVLNSDFEVARAMNDLCAQRMRMLVERFAAQTSLPTIARVAAALLPHAGPEPGLHPVLPSFQSVTQVELATAAGTVKEVVSRALAELESADAIVRSGGHIIKVDREKLTTFAGCL